MEWCYLGHGMCGVAVAIGVGWWRIAARCAAPSCAEGSAVVEPRPAEVIVFPGPSPVWKPEVFGKRLANY
jgi:hypothetical protein